MNNRSFRVRAALLLLTCVGSSIQGATLSIHWWTDRALYTDSGHPLSAGAAGDGDGALIELGYYSEATATAPFAGDWRVLAAASIGDDGIETPGLFDVATVLTGPVPDAPAVGTPLSIRFYDGPTVDSSIRYNAVSHTGGAWNWVDAADSGTSLEIHLSKVTGIRFLQQLPGEFATSRYLPTIPEPAALALGMAAGWFFARRRRRNRKQVMPL